MGASFAASKELLRRHLILCVQQPLPRNWFPSIWPTHHYPNMIFQHTHQLVMTGVKTQTRRIIKSEVPPCKVGKSLAVQPGRGLKAIRRIIVTDVYREELGRMTEKDVHAEGYASLKEFIETWERMHGKFEADLEVWVIKFRLAE